MGNAAAHLTYIEREGAVERQEGRERERKHASITREEAQEILDMPRKRGRHSLETIAAREHAQRIIEAAVSSAASTAPAAPGPLKPTSRTPRRYATARSKPSPRRPKQR